MKERGFDNSLAAILSDLTAVGAHAVDVALRGGEFSIPVERRSWGGCTIDVREDGRKTIPPSEGAGEQIECAAVQRVRGKARV